MYNRYIPQNDGTYCRRSVPEPQKEPPRPKPPEKPQTPPPPPPPPPLPCQNCIQQPHPRRRPPQPRQEPSPNIGIGSFLKQLLPRDFGTEDLLIVLLLLLMAGDCPEEQNSALLTLALYLFL